MDKSYYKIMSTRGRLMPFYVNERFAGFVTFLIGNKEDEGRFLRSDMWSIVDDNPEGNICYIDHLWTDKDERNKKLFRAGWVAFRRYIKDNFPNVSLIRWNRVSKNKDKVKIYKKEI